MTLDLLLIDDDAALAMVLADALRRLDYRTAIMADGAAAFDALARASFDAILLECALPGLDGLTVVRRLRQRGLTTPLLLHTTLGRIADRVEGLGAGADDYLVKPADPLEIDARIRALRRGRGYGSPEVETIRAGDIVVSPGTHRAWRAGKPIDLSKVELGLLAVLAREAGAVVTREALYARLWGPDYRPATNLAEAHVRRLRRKLMADGGADPIRTVRGVGYKLAG